jgi:hypothetical protein
MSPSEAWDVAASEVFPHSESLQKKSCPRGTYLGLCEEGLVLGISGNTYTRSRDNKSYALRAVKLLEEEPDLANEGAETLWKRVMVGKTKKHNSQMHVVLALWRGGFLTETVQRVK